MSFKSPLRGFPAFRTRYDAAMGGDILQYLLRDEFVTNRAAGSVNGTAAEPGPGTRTVVDTDGNKMSITGGQLSYAPKGVVTTGDPGCWYDAVTRTAGRLMVVHYNPSTLGGTDIDFDSNQSVAPYDGIRTGTGAGFLVVDAGAGRAVGSPTMSNGNDYYFAIVLRASGLYAFIKGGIYTDWVLLWQSNNGVTATLYPAIANRDSTAVSDYLRVPDEIWLPTPLCYDTFTRANGALGSTEAAGPDAQTTTQRTWTNSIGTTLVSGNAASASVLSGGIAIATVDTSTTNIVLSSTLIRSGNEIGVVLRYADSNNYIRAYHDGTNAKLDKIVGGAPAGVISAVKAYAAGAAIVVIADGTSFSLYYNNAKIGSTSTVADAALQTGTAQGTYSTNTGNTQDNFQVFPRGDGAYDKLEDF